MTSDQQQALERVHVSADTLKRQIIPSAILAASAHNTQPWKFKVSDNVLDMYIDWSRHLHVSDPELRQLYVSLGCAAANILVAAKYWNNEVETIYFPEGEGENKPVVRFVFSESDVLENEAETGELFSAIERRHTNRMFYDGKPLVEKERDAIYLGVDSRSVVLAEDKQRIGKIAKITEEGTFSTLSRKDFKEELSRWVRNSWTRLHDGMPGYAMGIPAPLSLVAPMMVKVIPIHTQEAPKIKKQAESSSAVAVFATQEDKVRDWLKAGEQLQRAWLNATRAGLAAMPIIAAVEAGEKYRNGLKEVLETDMYPQSVLRIGHAAKNNLRATPRRTMEECLV